MRRSFSSRRYCPLQRQRESWKIRKLDKKLTSAITRGSERRDCIFHKRERGRRRHAAGRRVRKVKEKWRKSEGKVKEKWRKSFLSAGASSHALRCRPSTVKCDKFFSSQEDAACPELVISTKSISGVPSILSWRALQIFKSSHQVSGLSSYSSSSTLIFRTIFLPLFYFCTILKFLSSIATRIER